MRVDTLGRQVTKVRISSRMMGDISLRSGSAFTVAMKGILCRSGGRTNRTLVTTYTNLGAIDANKGIKRCRKFALSTSCGVFSGTFRLAVGKGYSCGLRVKGSPMKGVRHVRGALSSVSEGLARDRRGLRAMRRRLTATRRRMGGPFPGRTRLGRGVRQLSRLGTLLGVSRGNGRAVVTSRSVNERKDDASDESTMRRGRLPRATSEVRGPSVLRHLGRRGTRRGATRRPSMRGATGGGRRRRLWGVSHRDFL